MEHGGMWKRVDLALIFIFIAFELIAGVAVYQRAVSNTARIAGLEQSSAPPRNNVLDSLAWHISIPPDESATMTYKPLPSLNDEQFCQAVISNATQWRKAIRGN